MTRPRIAAIIPGLPEPRDRGTYYRYAAMIGLLARLGDVDCCCLRDRTAPPGAVDRFARSVARLHVAPLELRPWDPFVVQLVRRRPPFVQHWYDPALIGGMRAFFAGRDYDLVFVGDLVSLPYAVALGLVGRRCWIDRSRVDVEWQRQRRATAPAPRWARRVGDAFRQAHTARYERYAARVVGGEIVCSESDARALRACVGDRLSLRVVANGIDRHVFPDQGDVPAAPIVVFPGAMDYAPNVDAVRWFAREAWPRVRARRPDAIFAIVGQRPTPAVLALDGRDGIRVVGAVPAMAPWYGRARCVVAPIRIGGGTRLKVVECWSAGRPLVATRTAVDGLEARDGVDCLLAEDPVALADATLAVLADDALARRLRAGAQATAAKYEWDELLAPLAREWGRRYLVPPADRGAA